jgi:hypothetical protein
VHLRTRSIVGFERPEAEQHEAPSNVPAMRPDAQRIKVLSAEDFLTVFQAPVAVFFPMGIRTRWRFRPILERWTRSAGFA